MKKTTITEMMDAIGTGAEAIGRLDPEDRTDETDRARFLLHAINEGLSKLNETSGETLLGLVNWGLE